MLACLVGAGALTAVAGARAAGAASTRYEAEKATLAGGVVVESRWCPCSGGAAVGGFRDRTQSVRFTVTVPAAGTYQATFGYTAAWGPATRVVTVNGTTRNVTFPATPTWGAWTQLTTTLALPAGTAAVTLTGTGDAWLNLDYLDIVATTSPVTTAASTTTTGAPATTVPRTTAAPTTVAPTTVASTAAPTTTAAPATTVAPTTTAATTSAPPTTIAPPLPAPAPAPSPIVVPGAAPVDANGTYRSSLGVPDALLPWLRSTTLLWNQALPAQVPLDPGSASKAATLAKIARGIPINGSPVFGHGGFEDRTNAPNLYVVDSTRLPLTTLTFNCGSATSWWGWSASKFESYMNGAYPGRYGIPIPAGIVMDPNEQDSQASIYDVATDTYFTFWLFRTPTQTGRANYEACWGGYIAGYSKSTGMFPYPTGVVAAGFGDLQTMVSLADVRRGVINHAVAISIPNVDAGGFSYPANRNDGWCSPTSPMGQQIGAQNCIYEGQRLRLPADFDTSRIAHPLARMLAQAAKDYGFVVQDQAGCVCVQFESSVPVTNAGSPDPWATVYAGTSPYAIYDQFPWEALQVVAKDYGKPAGYVIPTV